MCSKEIDILIAERYMSFIGGIDKMEDKEIFKLLWDEIEKIKKHPEFAPHHKFAKEFAIGWIVMNIIAKFERKYGHKELMEMYKELGIS